LSNFLPQAYKSDFHQNHFSMHFQSFKQHEKFISTH